MKKSIASEFPKIAKMWDKKRNEKKAKEVSPNSQDMAYWICPKGHVFQDRPRNMTKYHHQCPYCNGRNLDEVKADIQAGIESAIAEYPVNLLTPEICVDAVIHNQTLINKLPLSIIKSEEFVKRLLAVDKNRTTNYFYSKDHNKFCIRSKTNESCKSEVSIIFSDFDSFYTFMEGKIAGTDMSYFDFTDFDFAKYDMRQVKMPSKFQKQIGCYDDSLEKKLKAALSLYPQDEDNFTTEIITEEHFLVPVEKADDFKPQKYIVVSYISDLHLLHHLLKKYPETVNHVDVCLFLRKIINDILPKKSIDYRAVYLVIAGDVSDSFYLTNLFYSILSDECKIHSVFEIPIQIISVLGNHELRAIRNSDPMKPIPLSEIKRTYQDMANQFGFTLLDNQIVFVTSKNSRHGVPYTYLTTANDLETIDSGILEHTCFCIFGGTGFSGENKEYNANNGLYGFNRSYQTDQNESQKFFQNYVKFSRFLKDQNADFPVIILSHNPPRDWMPPQTKLDPYIYLYGHTHSNFYHQPTKYFPETIYADNQVGFDGIYENKYFSLDGSVDIFKKYQDGIYEITPEKYLDFYRNLLIHVSGGHVVKFSNIIMVKRGGFYIFLAERPDTKGEKLYLLDGGAYKIAPSVDANYYYDNLPFFTAPLLYTTQEFQNILNSISKAIISIGGDGYVHGCIIDIDRFNHIYIDPLNKQINYYNALDCGSRTFYDSLNSLLKKELPSIYRKYITAKSASNDEGHQQTDKMNQSLALYTPVTTKITGFYCEQDFYRVSKVICKFQHLVDNHIVRVWSESLLEQCKQLSIMTEQISQPEKQKQLT